jgi:hypothetical protein
MQTREKSDLSYLTQYSKRMWDGSGMLLSRPADAPADGTANLSIGLGTSRPWEAVGLALTDIESSLRSLDVPLGKYGHQTQIVHNTTMVAAGGNALGPNTEVPRLLYPARDVRSAPGRLGPGPTVRDDMPLYPTAQMAGISARSR